ncbi:adenylate/guanylate cyclase domain-containing protein [Clostridium peptidivorans]|uniref:adenylate/guanylate cyclase domain-containing protein n=1 Tax=Clostridium peptidivorans TaxID=100174 RepID=UPI000BE227AE|nr:adenylate/guanylate cyclase domain-containing protein [Clostridium peptidivorans]
MNNEIIKKEFENANSAIESILSVAVESIELSDSLPILDEIPDSNKVFKGKLSVLFVDMRKSTDLTDEIKSKKMVKVYRSFIRLVIQAIRYSGGFCRQFAGDGVMGVFQDITEGENTISSEVQAVRAGRYIITLIDFCLNPLLKQYMDLTISCGVGICTGTVMITKVGMRGKESDSTAENELGITWVGPTTNYSSRLCSLAQAGEIFIDEATFERTEKSNEIWKKTTRIKADKAYHGYIALDYYLSLDKEIEAQPIRGEDRVDETTFVQEIFDETQEEALRLIGEISKISIDFGKKLQQITEKEKLLSEKQKTLIEKERLVKQVEAQLETRKATLSDWESRLKNEEHSLHINIIKKAHCKKDFTIEMGKDFWKSELEYAGITGKLIGKSETEVKKDVCYALVSIYQDLQMWNEAYFALCIQAEYYSWIHAFTIEQIVNNSKMGTTIKEIIEKRLQTALFPGLGEELLKGLDFLKRSGY